MIARANIGSITLALCLGFAMAGCSSVQTNPAAIYHPAPDPNFQVFELNKHADLLVAYDERNPFSGQIQRRAYFLEENEQKIIHGRPPHFVSPETSLFMTPLSSGKPLDNSSVTTWVEFCSDKQNFAVCEFDKKAGPPLRERHTLPIYPDFKTRSKNALSASIEKTSHGAEVVAEATGTVLFFVGYEALMAAARATQP